MAIKATPARPNMQKAAIDLGCTPLTQTATSRITSTMTFHTISQSPTKATSQPQTSSVEIWPTPKDAEQHLSEGVVNIQETVVQDCNQKVLFGHVDQFGNSVKVQGSPETVSYSCETFVPVTEQLTTVERGNRPTLDMLRSNPLIQQMVEECIAILDSKSEN